MNSKTMIAALALTAASAFPAMAQLTVGTPNRGNCYPFNCNDSGTSTGVSIDYQQIFSSTAFPGPLTINSITFVNVPFGGTTQVLSGNYDITFGTTSDPLGSNNPLVLSNVGTFFDMTLGTTNVGATYTFLGAPYAYDPASGNLVMEVFVVNQALVPNDSGNGYFAATELGLSFLGPGTRDMAGFPTRPGSSPLSTPFLSRRLGR
jgi:hypothetical protein